MNRLLVTLEKLHLTTKLSIGFGICIAIVVKTEGWYRRIVQAIGAKLAVDNQGAIILSNAKAEEVFGLEPGTRAGQHVEALIPSSKALAE